MTYFILLYRTQLDTNTGRVALTQCCDIVTIRQLSEEVRVTSGVPQGSVLCPLLFLAYVNNIWRNMESTIRLFADDCVIYRKIINNEYMEKL